MISQGQGLKKLLKKYTYPIWQGWQDIHPYSQPITLLPVSYTHLDVYKRQGVARLIKSAYKLLNLETYFTAGVQEVRAWTYEKGWKAPQCAGVIPVSYTHLDVYKRQHVHRRKYSGDWL